MLRTAGSATRRTNVAGAHRPASRLHPQLDLPSEPAIDGFEAEYVHEVLDRTRTFVTRTRLLAHRPWSTGQTRAARPSSLDLRDVEKSQALSILL